MEVHPDLLIETIAVASFLVFTKLLLAIEKELLGMIDEDNCCYLFKCSLLYKLNFLKQRCISLCYHQSFREKVSFSESASMLDEREKKKLGIIILEESVFIQERLKKEKKEQDPILLLREYQKKISHQKRNQKKLKKKKKNQK